MKKTKILLTLSSLSLLAGVPFFSGASLVKGEGVQLSGLEIDDTYNIGDLLFISKNATLSEGDKNVKIISSYLSYPNGKNVSSSSYKLDSFGKYKLVLTGEDGLSYSKEFAVYKDVYSFKGNKSDIAYGKLNEQFISEGYPNGLKVNLTEGDVFTYAEPINVLENKYQKLLTWNVNDNGNFPSVHAITLRVTDAYNANNYFEITNSKGTYYYENYFTASYNGGRSAGLTRDDTGSIVVDGSLYRMSPTGGTKLTGNSPVSGVFNNVTYYLDSSNPEKYRIYAETASASEYELVAEFNNSSVYPETFKGLKTGLAYLSVTASGYSGIEKAPLELANLAGKSGQALDPMDYYKDSIKPLIEVRSEKEMKIMGGVEIAIPEAKAYDETALQGDVRYSVWYGYDSSSKKMVLTKNGRFKPEELGVYTIIYEALDVYGNLAQERVDLSVSEFGTSGIAFQVKPLVSLHAGTHLAFNNFDVVSLNGDCKTTIELTYPNGEKKTFDSEETVELPYSGKYHVVYHYKDAFYEGETSDDFDVLASLEARFISKNVSLPHYFMKGASYTLDVPMAYIYGEKGKVQDEVLAYAKFDNGEYQAVDATDVTIPSAKKVRFKFVPKTNPNDVIETEEIDVVDTGWDGKKVDLTKYFVGDFAGKNVTNEDGKDADFVRFQSTKTGNGTMEFVNKLLLSGFSFNFKASSFRKLTIRLTSYYEEGKEIEIVFSGNSVSVNGRSNLANENWNGNGASVFYNSSTSSLSVAGASFQIGSPFENDTFFLKLEAEGLSTNDYIDISTVGNQPFRSGNVRDRIAPMASANFPEKIAYIGDKATVSRPNVADVLTPTSDKNATLSVLKNKNGKMTVMNDVDSGIALSGISDFTKDYRIQYDDYGPYIITYTALDGAENSISGGLKSLVSVLDLEAPEIITKVGTYTIKAGAESVLPHIEVKDNFTMEGNFDIWHLVYDSKNCLAAEVQDGDKFIINEKGTYKVYVMAQDEEGNVAYSEYVLIVE